MSCPYLTEVRMVFCSASPVHKLVPSDRLTTAGPCQGDCYRACPLYGDALAQAGREIGAYEAELSTPSDSKKGVQS
jgi:hypothetical protein